MRLRRRAATVLDEVSRIAGCLADRFDPPRPPVWPEERAASRARHPSTVDRPQTLLGDVATDAGPLAEVVPFPRAEDEPDGWVTCTLGVISATRPIGARVRLTHQRTGLRHEGTIGALEGSDVSLVYYRLTIEEADGPTILDLPLSHPLEVRRD